jgi:hypothetical protein
LETKKSWKPSGLENYPVLETSSSSRSALAERSVGEGDPGVAVMLNILIHGAILQMRLCDEISVRTGSTRLAKPRRNLIRPAF